MHPSQLLDPKGFAKAKTKKRTPNYDGDQAPQKLPLVASQTTLPSQHSLLAGPQQSRKAPPSTADVQVVIPTYDPRALLNPKAAPKSTAAAMDSKSEVEEAATNPGTYFEKLHNVKVREAPAAVKRKVVDADDEEDSDHKKQKTTFGPTGKGGIISDHLKKEREAHAAVDAVPAPIDLTSDNEDAEVQIIKATPKEVLLGVLHVKAHCSMVPAVPTSKSNKKDLWHGMKLGINRRKGYHHVIELFDHAKNAFGRIEPAVANAISPLMDGSATSGFRMKALLKPRRRKEKEEIGQPTSEILHILLMLYSPKEKAQHIGIWLSQKQLYLGDPPQQDTGREYHNPQRLQKNHTPATVSTHGSRSAQSIAVTQRTAEEKKEAIDRIFDGLTRHEDLEEMEQPVDILTPLLKHQKQALQFMTDHENADNTAVRDALWQVRGPAGKEVWQSIITGQEFPARPDPTLGGILADMMGLGKTLSIISLIATTRSQAGHFLKSTVPQELVEVNGVPSRATLIICPTSVLTNWTEQITSHVSEKKCMRLHLYHGPNRNRDAADLARSHVVLTTYGTVSAEAKATEKTALFRTNWFRIVLDEAHQIRNATTEASKAVCSLYAQRRWAVTGTPVQNRLDDMAALIKFLRVKPFDEPGAWTQYITAPFRLGKPEALEDLRLLVDSLTIRRMKDTIGLPKRTEVTVRLQFNEDERRLYSSFSKQSRLKLTYLLGEGNKIRGSGYSHVLKSILRLRMICCHGQEMVSEADMKDIEGYDAVHAIDLGDEPSDETQGFIGEREAYEMFEMQQDTGLDVCQHCEGRLLPDDNSSDAVADDSDEDEEVKEGIFGFLTPCFHLLHPECQAAFEEPIKAKVAADNYYECAIDHAWVRNEYFALAHEGLQEYRDEKSRKSKMRKQANYNPENYRPSTKVQALIEELQKSAEESEQLPKGEPPIRSVVFSEWTTYLDLIGIGLEYAGLNYVRLDGSMNVRARAKVLEAFKTDPTATIMIVSVKAGGQGLNYTTANKVYLMEPQFNPGVEQQAVDRVHRLGQSRDVEITHYIMTDSIEESILQLQDKKVKLANLSLDRKRTQADEAQQRLAELRDLFK